jgi:hypothetical protein
MKHGVPQVPILGPLLFIVYISDLPSTISFLSDPIIFADDTSIIISSKKFDDFHTRSNTVVSQISKWYFANKLALNFIK